MAKRRKMPAGNIFWRHIPVGAAIEDWGPFWVARLPGGAAVVDWSSRDAAEAQRWLRRHAVIVDAGRGRFSKKN